MHGDRFLSRLDVDVGGGGQPGEQRPELTWPTGEGHPDTQVARGRDRTCHDLRRSMITAHSVDSDHSGRDEVSRTIVVQGRPLAWLGIGQLAGGGWRSGRPAQDPAARLMASMPLPGVLVSRVPLSRMSPSFSLR